MSLIDNYEQVLKLLYGNDSEVLKSQLLRYNELLNTFNEKFDENEIYLFSSPGRTELGGNHTDHNNGLVLAASVNLDSIAVASKNNKNLITIYSEGFSNAFSVNLDNLEVVTEEKETTNALIRGIAFRMLELGFSIGGFNAVISSDVLPGSGLSSSASVEVLIGCIFNSLFNNGAIKNEEIAKIGQWTENNYFGKPCGLMDQLACAVGGIIGIDFQDSLNPIIDKIECDFESQDYQPLLVETGGTHEDLTEEYASIPKEMKSVANMFEKDVCRELDYEVFCTNLANIRNTKGDRAALRALHFFDENKRVKNQVSALKNNDFQYFLNLVKESGNSSIRLLQNIYPSQNPNNQSANIVLALTEKFISKYGSGVCRIHGGGFGGAIQVFLPAKFVNDYKTYFNKFFNNLKVIPLNIRLHGAVCLNELSNFN